MVFRSIRVGIYNVCIPHSLRKLRISGECEKVIERAMRNWQTQFVLLRNQNVKRCRVQFCSQFLKRDNARDH